MSDTHDQDTGDEAGVDNDDAIITEPPDPLAGADDSVAKVGERLQEEVDEAETKADVDDDAERG